MSFLAKSSVGKEWNRKIQDPKMFFFWDGFRISEKPESHWDRTNPWDHKCSFLKTAHWKNKLQKIRLKTQNQTKSTKKKFWNRNQLRSKKTVWIFCDLFGPLIQGKKVLDEKNVWCNLKELITFFVWSLEIVNLP